MKAPLTAIVLARNEEKNIEECLKRLDWCEEVLVIDDNSTDKTASIAKKHKAIVYKHGLQNDFAQQRNFALTKATHEWVLYIDADERVSEGLRDEIMEVLNSSQARSAYYIQRYDYMWGKFLKHAETADLYLLRLAKRDAGKWNGKVHESWVTTLETGELAAPLLHYPHVTLSEFLDEINFYSTLRAEELFEQDVHVPWWHIIVYPKAKFVQNYFLRFGFLDGTAGLVFAMVMSLHSFLVRAKLWMLWQKK